MKAEIINVGTELLLGGIVNLNSRYLSEELASLGIGVYYQTSVGDNPARLKKVLATAVSRSNVIIITGGLGPTADDITKETVAAALNIPLVEDVASLDRIEKYFAASGRTMPEANRKQALCPRGAVIFKNLVGTAPGYALNAGKQHIIMLPGPPRELKSMFDNSVKEYLSKFSDGVILSKEVRIFGMGESEVAEKVADLLDMENPTVAPYAKSGEVELRVTAKAETAMKAHEICMAVVNDIIGRLGDIVYTHTYANLQETVVAMLKEKDLGLSTAESCTAGLLSSRLTEISGASQVFNFGVTTYANEMKQDILGVKAETIEQFGAVSEQTAIEMAAGARNKGKTKLGVAITGVAGPKASEAKPVGLVYVALCDEEKYWCRELHLSHKAGDRDAIRNLAVMNALDMVRLYLANSSALGSGKPFVAEAEEIIAEEKASQPEINPHILDVADVEFLVPEAEAEEEAPATPEIPEEAFQFLGYTPIEEETEQQPQEVGFWANLKNRFARRSEPTPPPAVLQQGMMFYSGEEDEEDELPEQAAEEFPRAEEIAESLEQTQIEEIEATEEIAPASDIEVEPENIAEEAEDEPEVQADEPTSEETDEVQPVIEFVDEIDELLEEPEAEVEETLISDIVVISQENEEEKETEEMAKSNGAFKRVLKAIFPWKGDKVGEIIRKTAFLVALAVFVGAAVYLISFFSDQSRNTRLINNVRDQWNQVVDDDTTNEEGIYNRFQFLIDQNPDVIGWIKINDTNVDNPVYQSSDLFYYENHNMAKEESRYGALFAHPDCYIDADTVARNITIYGHNTQDGSMFGNLTKYRLSGFYKRHPIIEFDTLYREGEYKIFSAMIVNAYPGQDDGYAYDYSRTTFSSDLDFEMWIDEARKRSMYNTGIDVTAEDEIITLSTCVYDFYEARLVIMARRVREGESTKIDTSVVKDNGKNTLYPQAYYDVYGGTKPDYYTRDEK